MRLSAMGDVAMTVPVLRAFVEQNPGIKITVISRPFFKPFFDTIPTVSFFAFDEKNRHKGFLGLIRLFSDLKSLILMPLLICTMFYDLKSSERYLP
jgi:ADP-heptose:LPS heptosyltransferase